MTTASVVGAPIVASASANDAWFRILKNLSDALTTIGIPKTADTGQVNWASVTIPATGVYTAYEIRKLNDATAGADPVFMRIDYGAITIGSNRHPILQITLGTGSNGAGTLTGTLGLSHFMLLDYTSTGKTDWKISTDGSGFALMAGGGSNTARFWLLIERLRGADGEPLTGQIVIAKNIQNAAQVSNDVQSYHYDFARSYYENYGGIPVGYIQALTLISSSLATLVSLKYPFGIVVIPTESGRGYSKLMVGYAYADFLNGTEFDLTRFTDNEVCHYRCVKPSVGPYFFGTMNSDMTITGTTNPASYGVPAMYWQ